MPSNDLYRVKDLYLAAFLRTNGKVIQSVEKTGSIYWFMFPDRAACEQLANLYWTNQKAVLVMSYVESIRSLKDIIFAQT